jgi:hypothetical protein
MTVPKNTYVGRRYIPKLFQNPNDGSATWTNSVAHESLTIVMWQGSSYTSRQDVPIGIDINDTRYWTRSADYNAQISIYEQNVRDYHQYVIDQIGLINTDNETFKTNLESQNNTFKTGLEEELEDYKTNTTNDFNTQFDNFESDYSAKISFLEQLKLKFIYNINGDGTDESVKLQNAINDAITGNTIYFPCGTYKFKNININKPLYLKGVTKFGIAGLGTTIQMATGGTYIFKIYGASGNILDGGGIEGIRFDCENQNGSYIVRAEFISNLIIEQNGFNNFNGSALSLQRVMESHIKDNFFRKCGNNTNDVIYLDSVVGGVITENINNLHIENNGFGFNSGNWISSALDGNLDNIWIRGSKFEWDGTPTYSNSSAKSVINLGQVFRCYISENSFTNFKSANNNYDTLITLINGNGSVTINDNKMISCIGTWLNTSSPRVVAKNNECTSSTLAISCSSPLAQDIDEVVSRNSDGSLQIPQTSFVNGFVSSHKIGGVQKRTFVNDNNSLTYCKTVKSSNTQYDEFGRINIGSYVGYYNTTLTLKLRVKATTADAIIDCYLDNASLGTANVTYANGWSWVSFTITVASITPNSVIKVRQNSATGLGILLDGYIII